MRHPGVDKVTFTGSPKVGRGIMQGAASNFKKVTLELGGKSANVIFADANLDRAVRAASSGIFFNAGQVCSAGSRVLVERAAYDEVVQRLAERARAIRVGDPTDPKTTMGPVISAGQMRTVLDYIDIGKAEGASLVTGGARLGDQGYFIEPTVFANVEHEMRISQEEIFGPVLSVIPFDDEQDALRIANGTAYSLGGRSLERRHRARAPHGGRAQSRHGVDQHLRLHRCSAAVGRFRRIGLRAASMAMRQSRISPSRKPSGWRSNNKSIDRWRSPRRERQYAARPNPVSRAHLARFL